MSDYGFCALCEKEGKPNRVLLENLFEHLRIAHGVDAQPDEWPDGELVIIDKTLEPDDFECAP